VAVVTRWVASRFAKLSRFRIRLLLDAPCSWKPVAGRGRRRVEVAAAILGEERERLQLLGGGPVRGP
jgi:hypothetical protein